MKKTKGKPESIMEELYRVRATMAEKSGYDIEKLSEMAEIIVKNHLSKNEKNVRKNKKKRTAKV
jgi:hypothetical protein